MMDVVDDNDNDDCYAAQYDPAPPRRAVVVSLVGKAIGDDGARRIAQRILMRSNNTCNVVTQLDLFGCSLTDTAVTTLAQALATTTTASVSSLRRLNLGGNPRITHVGATALATTLLRHNNGSTLEWLSLAGNTIGYEGAQALGLALAHNGTLLELHLAGNDIGEAGCCALAKGLAGNHSLQELTLSANRMGTVGAIALAEALQVNTNLQRLDLCYNGIGEQGAFALAHALGTTNRSLRTLNCMSNPMMGAEGKHRLEQARQYNPTRVAQNLLLLHHYHHHPQEESLLSMSQVLQWMDHNTTLELLSL